MGLDSVNVIVVIAVVAIKLVLILVLIAALITPQYSHLPLSSQ